MVPKLIRLTRFRRERISFFKYETVLSFGAPVANKYKILVDRAGPMLFETNMVKLYSGLCLISRFQVLEIAKLMKEYIKEIVTRRR